MRIACPFCGTREGGEFAYLGDAKPKRPHMIALDVAGAAEGEAEAYYDYVYLRDNVAGEMNEYWYHGSGCRSWLQVTRNTITHEIISVEAAPGAGANSSPKAGAIS